MRAVAWRRRFDWDSTGGLLASGSLVAMTASAMNAPGPRGAPIIGSARELRRDPLGTLERARREHGDVVRLVLGPRVTRHALFHPDAVRRVLASEPDGYRKDSRVVEEVRWTLGQ